MWTHPQRAVLLGFVVGLIVFLSVRLAIDRRHVPDPQPPAGALPINWPTTSTPTPPRAA